MIQMHSVDMTLKGSLSVEGLSTNVAVKAGLRSIPQVYQARSMVGGELAPLASIWVKQLTPNNLTPAQ